MDEFFLLIIFRGAIHLQPNIDFELKSTKMSLKLSTLIHIKSTVVQLLLKRAGVPPDIANLLYLRDDTTGRPISKRQSGPCLFSAETGKALAKRGTTHNEIQFPKHPVSQTSSFPNIQFPKYPISHNFLITKITLSGAPLDLQLSSAQFV